MAKPQCPIDPKLFARDMRTVKNLGYDPYNSFDAIKTMQEDISQFEAEFGAVHEVEPEPIL